MTCFCEGRTDETASTAEGRAKDVASVAESRGKEVALPAAGFDVSLDKQVVVTWMQPNPGWAEALAEAH